MKHSRDIPHFFYISSDYHHKRISSVSSEDEIVQDLQYLLAQSLVSSLARLAALEVEGRLAADVAGHFHHEEGG